MRLAMNVRAFEKLTISGHARTFSTWKGRESLWTAAGLVPYVDAVLRCGM